ncbi:MAG: amidohydrolase [Pseudoxanthomonas sp.]|nr:amidohydrolase [Pseudoxanthomonas sp.]
MTSTSRWLVAALAACACPALLAAPADAWRSSYQPAAHPPTLIRGATALLGNGERLEQADILLVDGRIERIGSGLSAPAGAIEIDGRGKWVTPGLIDVHSHLGVYPSPGMQAHSDGNEMTSPATPQVWAEHAVWPQDPGFHTALAGGVTAMQILPGSGNLIGGRGVTLKNVPAVTYQEMKFPDAPQGLKMACGENPKRFYGGRGQAPMTRMGNVAGYRAAFQEASEYRRTLQRHAQRQRDGESQPRRRGRSEAPAVGGGGPLDTPKRDLRLETLVGVLDGEILLHVHCYRADEMAVMLDLAREFEFQIAAFHHGVEAYKLADTLAREGVCGALWADWWGFKMEAYDAINENIALVDRPEGGCAIVHSDSSEGIQRLNQEAAKVMAHAAEAGIDIPPERAITWLTRNAARSLGIESRTGTLEAGKMADVVLWDRNPFSVYAKADQVFVDGVLLYDRADPRRQPLSDFMLGQEGAR